MLFFYYCTLIFFNHHTLSCTGSIQHFKIKSYLLLVHFYIVLAQFQIKIASFSSIFTIYVSFCTQIVVPFFILFNRQCFYLSSEIRHTFQSTSKQPLPNSSASNQSQLLTTASIISKQIHGF